MFALLQPGSEISGRHRWSRQPLPPYSYVPGFHPHPVTDPSGHMYGESPQPPSPLDPSRWINCPDYLVAIDLFNHGYYWEAHETWEGLWHAAGRRGRIGAFLKGLIKLSAAAVKAREGNPVGVTRHARRAQELFETVVSECDMPQKRFAGFIVDDLARLAELWQNEANRMSQDADTLRTFQTLPRMS